MYIICILIGFVLGNAAAIGVCMLRERSVARKNQEYDEWLKIPKPPASRRKKAW